MTASARTTPPFSRLTESGSDSFVPAPETMQSPGPGPLPGSEDPQGTQPGLSAQRSTSDGSKNDEYEVVDVGEDEDAEEIPRTPRVTRPSLPRLNSRSRTSPSVGASITAEREISTGPVHVRDTKEIPIPMPKRQTAPQTKPKALPSPTESDHSRYSGQRDETRESHHDHEYEKPQPTIGGNLKMNDRGAPNPKIQIPKVTSVASGLILPPNLVHLATGLEGKFVDEFGNILDWNGQVLGRAEGDLPAMIGRPVAATGEILSEHDEVVGYVAENDTIPPAPPSPKPIEGMAGGLKVDHLGNIIDGSGNVVGHFNGAPLARSLERTGQTEHSTESQPSNKANQTRSCSCGSNSKPSAAPSPSEIFLDVKSTTDGIQLIIKIPTVFNSNGGPKVHIG